MRIWTLSDLHLELTRGWDLPAGAARPQFDLMVVAGDLVPRMERGVKWLLERVPDKPVIYIPGNHEPYGTDIDRTLEKAKLAAEDTNVHVLQDETVVIDDVTVVATTLWTDFNLFGDQRRAMAIAGERMNDYKKIRLNRYVDRFRPPHSLARHTAARAFLEAELRKPRNGPLVIVTHHAPYPGPELSPAGPDGRLSSEQLLSAAYRSDLTSLMHPAPATGDRGPLRPANLWIYGHTHESDDVMIGETRIVSNAKGYGPWPPQERTWDNQGFDPNFVVEV
ncbi:putative phosphodiesterase [Bradyrhizobium sp. USDA 4341]